MGRPSDWSLLGGADPCPGSIDEALGLSDSWGRCAGGLSDAHRVLSGVEVSGAGNAVIAAGDLVRSSAGLLGVYRDACEGCAHALTMWARALEMLQSEADRLHAQALQAKDDQEAGQRMIATGRDERIR
ncbi:hypothetical protein [Acaricomes phytoseiuli]|uniref:hypothetical protein n=1 Tax=Acaricomes phytoseiuli TaxID=291968 RepID=UPI00036B9354|nr:hypothetical protein [Acaricomes phytoseiuli]